MNCDVAVLAGASERLDRHRTAENGAVTEAMTFGTQSRPRYLQHVFVVAAVRIMAAQAVFPHRRVLEQERAALLSVAFVTGVVDGVFPQQRFGRAAAVRIVTVRTGDLAFAQRHVRRAEDLGASVLVTLETGVHLDLGLQRRLARYRSHDGMAFGARNGPGFVRAAHPVGSLSALVASEADRIVHLDPAGRIVPAE